MEKIFKLLHKHYDISLMKLSEVKKKQEDMRLLFKQFDIESSKRNSDIDFFYNEVMYQGILNKQAIETAYFEGKVMMNDYYTTLDYGEKRRLMNYETSKAMVGLPSCLYDEKVIYIPFFDERMNEVYKQEMVLFDIKKYNYYVRHFKNIMQPFYVMYGNRFYNAAFCSAVLVYEDEDNLALYCKLNQCLYFIKNQQELNHITIPVEVEEAMLERLSYAYFHLSFEEFIENIETLGFLKEKEMRKIRLIMKKVKV